MSSVPDDLTEPPRPSHAPALLAQTPAVPISQVEREQISTASVRAKLLFPGVVGAWLARELNSCGAMGFRLDQSGLTKRLVEFLLHAPLPPKGAS